MVSRDKVLNLGISSNCKANLCCLYYRESGAEFSQNLSTTR